MDPESQTTSKDAELSNPDAKDDAEPSIGAKESDSKAADSRNTNFWLHFTSNILFLIGSVFYVWLAALDLQWAKEIQGVINAITGDDKDFGSWRDYELDGDDYVFQAGFYWVSKYQVVYFIAAFAFVVEGFVDFFGYPGIRGLCFIFAGTFGVVSAWLGERDADMSLVFNLMSAHLYMFEAIGLLVNRDYFAGLKFWVKTSDAFFVISTCIDVALSYTYIFDKYSMALTRLDVAAAAIWLTCAVIYVGVTIYAKTHGFFDHQEVDDTPEEQDELSEEKEAGSDDGSLEKVEIDSESA